MVGPFPGAGIAWGHGGFIALGVVAVVMAAVIALFLLVALVAFLLLLVRFLVVGTRAAEAYLAEHAARDADPRLAPAAPGDST